MQPILFATIQRDSVISFPMLGDLTLNPPASFSLFGRPIYFYGVLIAIGFLLATLYCSKHAPDFGIKTDDFIDLMLWIIPISILGARLYFVVFRWSDYAGNPLSALAVWEGGLAIYGGVIAGLICIILVCRHKKIPVAAMLEFVLVRRPRMPFWYTVIAAVPTLIYGICYMLNIAVNGIGGEWPDTNDFYAFLSWGWPVGIAIFAGITLSAFGAVQTSFVRKGLPSTV